MLKISLFIALLAACAAPTQAQNTLSAAKIPLRADAPQLFAPRGWKIEKTIRGDLNRDKIADTALVLVENKPAKTAEGYATERARALIVLLKEGKGWYRVGFNNSLLLGTSDGGAFYGVMETPVNVSIAKGVLIVGQESGSREVTETTHKFRFDARKNGVFLIGFDAIDRDRATGEVRSVITNYLTGIQQTTLSNPADDKTKRQTRRVSRKLRTLDSLEMDERYSG